MPNHLKPEIQSYYERNDERVRLDTAEGKIEFARTKELLLRHLPKPPATIYDIGGGPGRYACWLAGEGYEVHLVDASANLVEDAKSASDKQPDHPVASMTTGDARSLDLPDNSADAVLLMGPLYHLTDFDDRLRALREARRVLKPGGHLFAVGICRYASALVRAFHKILDDEGFAKIVARDLVDGQHRNNTDDIFYFTTAYFHHPDELAAEIDDAGLHHVETLGIEGPAWLIPDLEDWTNPLHIERLLTLVRALESESALIGMSSHLMAIARK